MGELFATIAILAVIFLGIAIFTGPLAVIAVPALIVIAVWMSVREWNGHYD